jgi:hypothetical protein
MGFESFFAAATMKGEIMRGEECCDKRWEALDNVFAKLREEQRKRGLPSGDGGPIMNTKDSCHVCKFHSWTGTGPSDNLCVRYPPKLEGSPHVTNHEWCGEFVRLETKTTAPVDISMRRTGRTTRTIYAAIESKLEGIRSAVMMASAGEMDYIKTTQLGKIALKVGVEFTICDGPLFFTSGRPVTSKIIGIDGQIFIDHSTLEKWADPYV